MPMFYFHLSNCNECFRDNIGCDLADLTVAHTRARRLAHMVMMTSRLATTPEPDWRRWTVTVTDDPQGPMLIIPFGAFGIVPHGDCGGMSAKCEKRTKGNDRWGYAFGAY